MKRIFTALLPIAFTLTSCVQRANYIESLQLLPPVSSERYGYVEVRTTFDIPTDYEISESDAESEKWDWEHNLKRLDSINKADEKYFFEDYTKMSMSDCISDENLEQISEFNLFNPEFLMAGGTVPVFAPVVKKGCPHEGLEKMVVPITTVPGIMLVTMVQGVSAQSSLEPYALVGYAIYDFKTQDFEKVISVDLYLDPMSRVAVEAKKKELLIKGLPVSPKLQLKLDLDKDKLNTGLNIQAGLLIENSQEDGQGEIASAISSPLKSIAVDLRAKYFYKRYGVEYSYGIGRTFLDAPSPDGSEYTAFSPHITTTRHMLGGVYAYLLPQHKIGLRGLVSAGVSYENYTWNENALSMKDSQVIENGIGGYVGANMEVIINYYYMSMGVEYHYVNAQTVRNNVIMVISPVGFKF